MVDLDSNDGEIEENDVLIVARLFAPRKLSVSSVEEVMRHP